MLVFKIKMFEINIIKINIISFIFLSLFINNVLSEKTELSEHGFTLMPQSRSYLCAKKINKNCGSIQWEPQSIEGSKGFPEKGPVDGKLASGGTMFHKLDEYSNGRWTFSKINVIECENYVIFPIHWFLSVRHRTKNFRVYFSINEANETIPLSRSLFDMENICIDDFKIKIPTEIDYKVVCFIPREFIEDKLGKKMYVYLIWDIADTFMAFYQISDVILESGNIEDIYSYKQIPFKNIKTKTS